MTAEKIHTTHNLLTAESVMLNCENISKFETSDDKSGITWKLLDIMNGEKSEIK